MRFAYHVKRDWSHVSMEDFGKVEKTMLKSENNINLS